MTLLQSIESKVGKNGMASLGLNSSDAIVTFLAPVRPHAVEAE